MLGVHGWWRLRTTVLDLSQAELAAIQYLHAEYGTWWLMSAAFIYLGHFGDGPKHEITTENTYSKSACDRSRMYLRGVVSVVPVSPAQGFSNFTEQTYGAAQDLYHRPVTASFLLHSVYSQFGWTLCFPGPNLIIFCGVTLTGYPTVLSFWWTVLFASRNVALITVAHCSTCSFNKLLYMDLIGQHVTHAQECLCTDHGQPFFYQMWAS